MIDWGTDEQVDRYQRILGVAVLVSLSAFVLGLLVGIIYRNEVLFNFSGAFGFMLSLGFMLMWIRADGECRSRQWAKQREDRALLIESISSKGVADYTLLLRGVLVPDDTRLLSVVVLFEDANGNVLEKFIEPGYPIGRLKLVPKEGAQ